MKENFWVFTKGTCVAFTAVTGRMPRTRQDNQVNQLGEEVGASPG